MYRFLRWRYGGFKNRWDFEAAVITHPDQDHYSGFTRLFEDENVFFDTVYHNGIIETKGTTKESLGHSQDFNGIRYITELMEDQQALRNNFV